MTMKSKYQLRDIWSELEKKQAAGFVKKLLPFPSPIHVFATYRCPENTIGIAFSFNNNTVIDKDKLDTNLKELDIFLTQDTSFANSKLLIIELKRTNNKDIFATLSLDIIASISELNTEQKVIRTIINQLAKWKNLFEKNKFTYLTVSEQQGLFGELLLLEKLFKSSHQNMQIALNAWMGPEKSLRDFQMGNVAIEVKTSATNNTSSVTISSEGQLDEDLIDNLFLLHIKLVVSNSAGETLPDLVARIKKNLNDDIIVLNNFNAKLFFAGYFTSHEQFYSDRYYRIESFDYYKVNGDFPRIKKKDLMQGVNDVTYSISLIGCNRYKSEEEFVIKSLIS